MNAKSLLTGICITIPFFSFGAKIDTIAIETRFLDSPEKVVVITPDRDQAEKFPVLFLLNGYTDNHRSWLEIQPELPDLADAHGMLIVMPDGRDSWYFDAPHDSLLHMESFIINDLVPYVDRNYPVFDDAYHRAISGLSMGGHGAFWLGLRHPDIWKSIGSTSGGLDIRPFSNRWNLKKLLGDKTDNEPEWEDHTVINLISGIIPGDQNIIFDCGTDDFFFKVNKDMHEKLLEAGVPHDFIVRPGGHTRPYWANSIKYHLLFFDENINK